MARDPARAVPRPDPRLHRAARRPAARLPGHPPHRHQRQDVDVADDRHPAAGDRAADRPLHQPPRGADGRADLHRRAAAHRRGVGARVQRRGALHPPRRRVRGPPAVVLRDRRRDGVRRLRRRARSTSPSSRSASVARGTRPTSPTAAVAVVLPVAVDHAAYLGDQPAQIAAREGRDHQARRHRGLAEQQPDVEEVLLAPGGRGRRHGRARGRRLRGRVADGGGRRPDDVAAGAAGDATTRSSCRCTAPTRPRTPPWRSRPWRRSSATARSTRSWCAGAFAQVTSPGRLEVVRRSPTIVLDAAHNPHGAEGRGGRARGLLRLRPPRRRRWA